MVPFNIQPHGMMVNIFCPTNIEERDVISLSYSCKRFGATKLSLLFWHQNINSRKFFLVALCSPSVSWVVPLFLLIKHWLLSQWNWKIVSVVLTSWLWSDNWYKNTSLSVLLSHCLHCSYGIDGGYVEPDLGMETDEVDLADSRYVEWTQVNGSATLSTYGECIKDVMLQ